MLKKKFTSLWTLITRVYWTTLNIFPHWISKPCVRKHKNHNKASNGTGKFDQNLWVYKKSWYKGRHCKSGRHNQCHTSRRRKPKYKSTLTNILSYGLKVNGIKNKKTKPPSPPRRNLILNAIKHRPDISLWKSTKIEPPFLPFNEPNSCNDCIFMDQQYNDQLCFLNQVDLNTDVFDDMLFKRVVAQPTEKPRSVGPHK